jgi:hypothetical protein
MVDGLVHMGSSPGLGSIVTRLGNKLKDYPLTSVDGGDA